MSEIATQNEASEKSTEFQAKIIKYDSTEHPSAPILASSGEDINLIFKIPKEIFRKLAVAAIAHLDHSGAEKARTSNSDKSQNSEKSKFRFSDVVKNLGSENTNGINDAYKEDGKECDMSKSKDSKLEDNSKPCINGSSSNSSEFSGGSVPMCEAVKQTVEEKANSAQTSNDFHSIFKVPQMPSLIQAINIESVQESSADEKGNKQEHSDAIDISNEKNLDENESNGKLNKKMECGEDENGLKTQGSENHAVNEGENYRKSGRDKDCVESLSANSSDTPESENTWPNIPSFMETEKITITEMKSLESHGILTKYLKLELSDEFVVLKVTSESKVFVDAVKYKGTEKCSKETEGNSEDSNANNEHKDDLSLKETDCSIMDTDISVETLTADSNATTNSITETALINENGEHEEDLSCTSKPESETVEISEKLEPENDFKKELESITQTDVVLDDSLKKCTETADFRNSSKLKSEDKDIFIGDERSEIKSADNDTEIQLPVKFLEAQFGQMINPKIEKKLEELDTNISGCSPSERLEFSLNDSLKNVSSETAAKQMETIPSISGNLSISDAKENSYEIDNLQIKEKFLEDSVDECVAGNSEIKDFNEINVCHEVESSNVKENSAEIEFLRIDPGHESIAPEKVPIDSYLNADESQSMNKDSDLEKVVKSEPHFEIGTEVKIEKGDSLKSADEKESLEDSALGKELNFSESDSLNDCSIPKDTECKKTCSENVAENIPCVNEENKKSAASNNSNDENCLLNEESNKQFQDAIEATHFHTDATTDSTNSNFENSLSETITEEKYSSENKEIEASAENCYEANIELKHVSNEELKDMTKEELKNERIMEIVIADKSDENTLNEASDAQEDANETDTSSFKKGLLKDSKFLEDSISETADLEKRPENSFDSNLDSFLDLTVDTNTESTSECGDLESDDKSIVSESDDNKEDEKRVSLRRKAFESKKGIDEVDCAPTRVRTRKIKPELSKYVIPENAEVKSAKPSTLDTPSKYYQRKSPTARATRSKSLDPAPQQTKSDLYGKNGSIVESEGQTRKTRAKTPDIIGKKDIKTTARSSPRKLQKSAAAGESSCASKVQSTKFSNSGSNGDTPLLTRSKRSSKH